MMLKLVGTSRKNVVIVQLPKNVPVSATMQNADAKTLPASFSTEARIKHAKGPSGNVAIGRSKTSVQTLAKGKTARLVITIREPLRLVKSTRPVSRWVR